MSFFLGVLPGLLVAPASASPAATQLWLSSSARGDECGAEQRWRARLEQASQPLKPADAGGGTPELYVSLTPSATGFLGTLSLRSPRGVLLERKVEAARCEDVQDALILALEIYTDEAGTADAAPLDGAVNEQAELNAQTLTTPRAATHARSVPETRSAVAAAGEPAALPGSALALGAITGNGLLPHASWGGSLLARVSLGGRWALMSEASFAAAAPLRHSSTASAAGVDAMPARQYWFSESAVVLGAAWLPPLSRAWWLSLDAGPQLSVLHVSSDSDIASHRHQFPALGFSAGAGLLWRALETLEVEARLGLRAALLRGQYLDASRSIIWEPAAVGAVGGIYVGWAARPQEAP